MFVCCKNGDTRHHFHLRLLETSLVLHSTNTTMADPPLEEMISLTGLSLKTDDGDQPTSAKAERTPPTLLTLPREIRDIIYELVWSSPGHVRLADRSSHQKWLGEDGGPTFPEEPAMPYPPKTAAVKKEGEEDAATSEESDGGERVGLDSTDGSDLASFKSYTYTDSDDGSDNEDLSGGDDGDCGKVILVNTTIAALLFVNRQLYKEASPILYKSLTFILDCDGAHCLNFFKKLSPIAQQNITSLTITNGPLMSDEVPAWRTWASDAVRDRRSSELGLYSPFTALLAKTLPNLSEVSLFLSCGLLQDWLGDWYCSRAPAELSMMLKYGRLSKLNFVFFGKSAADAVKNLSSELCFKELMCGWGNGKILAKHEFYLRHHPGYENARRSEEYMTWFFGFFSEQEEYIKKHAKPFAWEWGDRELDMGSCGNVQAVVSCRRG